MRPVDLLLGVLAAEVGTVPCALALAGVDRDDLVARPTAFRAVSRQPPRAAEPRSGAASF
ncbi:hypothetical protein GCM10027089_06630 [Nocardia thraciensis]